MNLPVLAICGYSGSGKTTLIETLIPNLRRRGLSVAVIKHDAHGITVDHPGKDSDKFFRAGADVFLDSPHEKFVRLHPRGVGDLSGILQMMTPHYDLILVEGQKHTPCLDKIWLRRHSRDRHPAGMSGVRLDLCGECDRASEVMAFLDHWLPGAWLSVPVYAGVLIGGKSTRMGGPKHLIRSKKETWLERTCRVLKPCVQDVILLGANTIPDSLAGLTILPDVRDAAGPIAAMRAAMRWMPLVSWIFVACDMPLLSAEAAHWLLSTRAPGVWATIPALKPGRGVEPLLAHYDFRSHPFIECVSKPSEIAGMSKVATPVPPKEIAKAWMNVNSAGDLRRIGRLS